MEEESLNWKPEDEIFTNLILQNGNLTNFGKFAVIILSLSLPITIIKLLFRKREKIKWKIKN